MKLVAQKISTITDSVRKEGNQLFESARRIDKIYDNLVSQNFYLDNQTTISAQNSLVEVIADIEYYMSSSVNRLDKANDAIELFANQVDLVTVMASDGVVEIGG